MYAPRHFAPHELLPGLTGDETWETLDPDLRAQLDDRMLETGDQIHDLVCEDRADVCKVNDYVWGGARHWCGLRTPECKEGAPHSQHRIGKAQDQHYAHHTAEEVRAIVRDAVDRGELPHLGGIELGVSWFHFDVRDRIDGQVIEFHA